MIRHFEVIPAGMWMYNWMAFVNATRLEVGLLVRTLRTFSEMPFIGGRSSSGHGKIAFRYNLIRNGNKENDAIVFDINEGFSVANSFLMDCEAEFSVWLDALTPEKVEIFAKR